jgi:hypothetical protein
VAVSLAPLDPTKLAAPRSPLTISGNAYRISGTYRPSGRPLKGSLVSAIEIVLVYPALKNVHGSHTLILSETGKAWTEVDTNDLVSVGQADGRIDSLGYVAAAVTGAATATRTIPGGRTPHESFPIAVAIGITAALVLLAGVALGIRNSRRRPARPPRRPPPRRR